VDVEYLGDAGFAEAIKKTAEQRGILLDREEQDAVAAFNDSVQRDDGLNMWVYSRVVSFMGDVAKYPKPKCIETTLRPFPSSSLFHPLFRAPNYLSLLRVQLFLHPAALLCPVIQFSDLLVAALLHFYVFIAESRFFSHNDSYGLGQTLAAITAGAAAMVLFSETFATKVGNLLPDVAAADGYEDLKAQVVALCKEMRTELLLVKDKASAPGYQLCKDYGGICATLRWPLYLHEIETEGITASVNAADAKATRAAAECSAYVLEQVETVQRPHDTSVASGPAKTKIGPCLGGQRSLRVVQLVTTSSGIGATSEKKSMEGVGDSDVMVTSSLHPSMPASNGSPGITETWEELHSDGEEMDASLSAAELLPHADACTCPRDSSLARGHEPKFLNPAAPAFVPRGF